MSSTIRAYHTGITWRQGDGVRAPPGPPALRGPGYNNTASAPPAGGGPKLSPPVNHHGGSRSPPGNRRMQVTRKGKGASGG